MSPVQIASVATRALLRNKLRSFLTTLGIIIGVGAVIAMTAIGAGAKDSLAKSFESMGTRMLTVRSGSSRMGGVRGGAGSQPTLTWDDMAAITQELPSLVERVAPVFQTRAQVMAEGQNWNTSVQGTTPDFFIIRNWPAATGALFTDAEVRSAAKVAVLGATVVDNLFGPYADPIGQIVRVNNVPFEIVGVAASKGQSAFGGDNDDVVFVPETTYRSKLQGELRQYISGSITVQVTSSGSLGEAQAQIEELLRRRHRIAEGADDDFRVRNLSDVAQAEQEQAKTTSSLLAGIASCWSA
jgi:putative ABC transport system permease protein